MINWPVLSKNKVPYLIRKYLRFHVFVCEEIAGIYDGSIWTVVKGSWNIDII